MNMTDSSPALKMKMQRTQRNSSMKEMPPGNQKAPAAATNVAAHVNGIQLPTSEEGAPAHGTVSCQSCHTGLSTVTVTRHPAAHV